jgi:hypothetical protein
MAGLYVALIDGEIVGSPASITADQARAAVEAAGIVVHKRCMCCGNCTVDLVVTTRRPLTRPPTKTGESRRGGHPEHVGQRSAEVLGPPVVELDGQVRADRLHRRQRALRTAGPPIPSRPDRRASPSRPGRLPGPRRAHNLLAHTFGPPLGGSPRGNVAKYSVNAQLPLSELRRWGRAPPRTRHARPSHYGWPVQAPPAGPSNGLPGRELADRQRYGHRVAGRR